MRAPKILDIREAYHEPRPDAVHVPLGVLMADPGGLLADEEYAVVGHDARDAELAARFLRGVGFNARAFEPPR